jgi:hypothetical protein
MQFLGFILGMIGLIGWSVSLIAKLQWINWIFLPVTILGLVFCIIGMIISFHHRGMGIAGIVICLVVLALEILRLRMYFGFI